MEKVFDEMKSYHDKNGQVMPDEIFLEQIVRKHDVSHVITGLMAFNQYLDSLRKEAC